MIGKLTAALIAVAIIAMAFVPIVSAHAPSDYSSKYVATPANVGTPTGILRGQIACYHNLFSKEVLMTLQGTTQTTVLTVTNSGSFEANDVSPGVYDLVLTDGNGGQPEQTIVTIRAGQISFPERSFIGHAVSDLGMVRKPVTTITEATYGMTKIVIDQEAVPAVPGVPAVTHQQKVIDVPAQPATPATGVRSNAPGHVHADYLGNGHAQIDFYYNGQPMHITGNSHDDSFIVTPGHPAIPEQSHYITVIDVPAVPAVPAIEEVSHVEGTFADVTADVQAVVDSGVLSFKFRNDMNPGGIVSIDDVLLKAITDPAVGQVKNVMIKYTVDGEEKTINTQEYEIINL